MKEFRKDLWDEGEYTYEAAYGFMPNIRAYLHDEDNEKRRSVLVVPGGGYCMCAPHEGELVALEFYRKGMNAFVLTYTTDITMSIPLKKQPLNDIARAVRIIRKNAEEYSILPDKLVICGFSAAGHICASLATHFDDVADENPDYSEISCRPDGVILGYPVITSGEFTHIYSMWALLGRNASEEELEYFSLEKQVKKDTPPCFIWQTLKDTAVPVENSYLFAEALRKNKIDYAQYVFPIGDHGLSIASKEQFSGWNGGKYSCEQLDLVIENLKNDTLIKVSDQRKQELKEQFLGHQEDTANTEDEGSRKPFFMDPDKLSELFKDINMWPELAFIWMSRL